MSIFKYATIFTFLSIVKAYAIFGGVVTEPEDYPSIVELTAYEPTEDQITTSTCGATHLGDGFFVTAAHCVYSENPLLLTLGDIPISGVAFIRSDYDSFNLTNDIAIVYAPNIGFSTSMPMVTIDEHIEIEKTLREGQVHLVTAVGYGTTSLDKDGNPAFATHRLKEMTAIITNIGYYNTRIIDPDAKSRVCIGDSGSPLITFINGEYKILAIVSYIGMKNKKLCQSNDTDDATYQNVSIHKEWIKKVRNYCLAKNDNCKKQTTMESTYVLD